MNDKAASKSRKKRAEFIRLSGSRQNIAQTQALHLAFAFVALTSSCSWQDSLSKSLEEADSALSKGWYTKSEDLYVKILKKEPGLSKALAGRAEALAALGRYNEAIESMQKALAENRNNWQYYLKLGKIYLAASSQEEAIDCFDRGLNLAPAAPELYLARAAAYLALEKYSRTIEDCDLCLRLNPREAGAFVLRGSAYIAMNSKREGLEDLQQAILLKPHDPAILCSKASAEVLLKQYDQAILDFNKCLELSPAYARAYLGLGSAYMNKGDEPKAIEALSRGIKALPLLQAAYLSRAAAYFKLGNYEKAVSDYNTSMRLNASDPLPYLKAALCKLAMQRPLSASSDLEQFLQKSKWKLKAGLGAGLLALSYQQADMKSEADIALRLAEAQIAKDSWDYRIIAYLYGRLPENLFYKQLSRRDKDELYWTYFLLGLKEKAKEEPDQKKTSSFFEKTRELAAANEGLQEIGWLAEAYLNKKTKKLILKANQ